MFVWSEPLVAPFWMIDQARMRGKNVWVWLVPFFLASLQTFMLSVLHLQRRIQ
jgi:hypothetical protein